jgi:isopentenyldiphosphate isomerase
MEDYWERLVQAKKRVEDLPLYRLLNMEINKDCLILETGLTGYKEYQATNAGKPDWATANPLEKMANPLAISTVAISADNITLLQSRASNVGEYGCKWHVTPSGHIHPPQSVLQAMLQELYEELGVTESEIAGEALATGLIINKEMFKPEIIALVHLNLNADYILKRQAPDRWEYKDLQPVKWERDIIARILSQNQNQWVPPGHAALLLGGRIEFGDEWMQKVRESINCG